MAARFDFVAEFFVYALEAYSLAGLLFAALFVFTGVQRIDSEARGTGVGFRILIAPGVVALWPLFVSRWLRQITEPPVETNSHRLAAKRP